MLTIKNWKSTSLTPIKVWLIAFTPLFVVSVASVLIHDLKFSRVEVLEIYLGGLVFTAGFQHLGLTYEKVILGAKIAALLGLAVAIYEVFYLNSGRAGWSVNPVNFGFAAGIIGIILGASSIKSNIVKSQLTLRVSIAAAASTLILAGSRGPFVASLLVLLGAYLFATTRTAKPEPVPRRWKFFVLPIVLYIALGSTLLLPRTYFELVSDNPTSAKIRIDMAEEGVKQILAAPLKGIGSDQAGNFLDNLEIPELSDYNNLHSTLLNITLELGVLGGISFVWAMFYLIAYFLKSLKATPKFYAESGLYLTAFVFIASFFADYLSVSFARKIFTIYITLFLVLIYQQTNFTNLSSLKNFKPSPKPHQ